MTTLYIYVSNNEYFAKGKYEYALAITTQAELTNWYAYPLVATVEIDLTSVSLDLIRATALKELDEAEKKLSAEYQKALNGLTERKQNLLALPQPEPLA